MCRLPKPSLVDMINRSHAVRSPSCHPCFPPEQGTSSAPTGNAALDNLLFTTSVRRALPLNGSGVDVQVRRAAGALGMGAAAGCGMGVGAPA